VFPSQNNKPAEVLIMRREKEINKLKKPKEKYIQSLIGRSKGYEKLRTGFYLYARKQKKDREKRATRGKHCFEHFIVGLFLCFQPLRVRAHEMEINYGNNEFSLFLVNNYRHGRQEAAV
jgi:hypothetical protein